MQESQSNDESLTTAQSPEPESFFNPDVKEPHILLMMGYKSSTADVLAWRKELLAAAKGLADKAMNCFSFDGPGILYDSEMTERRMLRHLNTFSNHLPSASPEVVPVGFSLSGLISLVGTYMRPRREEPRIKDLILVAPATEQSKAMLRMYESGIAGGKAGTALERDLLDSTAWQDLARTAFQELTTREIHIHVIYSPQDSYCPFVTPSLTEAQKQFFHAVELADKRVGSQEAFHLSIPHLKSTKDTLCPILASALA
jgi:hypothetical protein